MKPASLLLNIVALLVCVPRAAPGVLVQGPGEKLLKSPPYYAGRAPTPVAGALAHTPVTYQRGAAQEPIFDPSGDAGSAVARLLDAINTALDSLDGSSPLGVTLAGRPPDVRFGCDADPLGDCMVGDDALGRGDILMRLAVDRPSREWSTAARAALSGRAPTGLLVITLEMAQYRVRQKGVRGDKLVDLGTGHTVSLPWLTSLDTPVAALILTGALVGPDGHVLRVGAEGIAARRTRLLVSALGGQELISDDDVEAALIERRVDLPGSPPTWQVAVRNLVAGLTGRGSPAR